MNSVKAGKAVIDVLQLAYAANRPILLKGAHGVGKSQLIEQAASALNIGCVIRDLSLMEPPDLVGLPRQQNGKTVYSPPSFLPTRGKGLLVFEEINRSERYMMAPCLQLLTARTLNDYQLPKGWLPVAAINPDGKGYDVHPLDPALESRFSVIEVVPDAKSWLEWATDNKVHPTVCRYVKQTRNIFDGDQSNPRAWTYVSDLLRAYENRAADRAALGIAITGQVGPTHASALMALYSGAEEPLDADAVLDAYNKSAATVKRWVKGKRMDLLESSLRAVLLVLQGSDACVEIGESKVKVKNLQRFAKDLPADFGRRLKSRLKEVGLS